MKNQDYIEKWLAGTLNEEEKSLFEKTDEFKSLQRMDRALLLFKPAPFNEDAAYENLKARREKVARVVQLNWSVVMKIAAVLVVAIGSYLYLSTSYFAAKEELYQTGIGQTREIALPDKSVVTLNAMSSISFSRNTWNAERKITLEGEAFFAVVKGGSFQVSTEAGVVTVLGTQFNVKDRDGFYEVTCYEGRVQVAVAGDPVQLTAQQSYREIEKIATDAPVELTETPSWFRNESSFQRVPFREVLNELERQYDVRIKTLDVDVTQSFTGKFPNTDLTTALQSVTVPFGLSYKANGKEIVFHGD
ncbi:MAG: FecR domain-containing protein [Cyclobacteriaceae bacterium]